MTMSVSLPDAGDEGFMKTKFTCDGENVSPEIVWSGVPSGTRSLVLIVDNPDAPLMTFVHWVVYNIPPASSGMEENQPRKQVTHEGYSQGISGLRKTGYQGPCPPGSRPHRYFFKLYATSLEPDLETGLGKKDLERLMSGHVIEEAETVVRYARKHGRRL